MQLSKLRDLAAPIFAAVPDLTLIEVGDDYRDYNDEVYMDLENYIRFEGCSEEALDFVPEVRRLERAIKTYDLPVNGMDRDYQLQMTATIKLTRETIKIYLTDAEQYHDPFPAYVETLRADDLSLVSIEFNPDDKVVDEEKLRTFSEEYDVPESLIGDKPLFASKQVEPA